MNEMICEFCKKHFKGRPNRKFCSPRCRRIIEGKRRFWDRRFYYVLRLEKLARMENLTSLERSIRQKKADETREKLLKMLGNRP